MRNPTERLEKTIGRLYQKCDMFYVWDRVNYYCRLDDSLFDEQKFLEAAITINKLPTKFKNVYDTYFPGHLKCVLNLDDDPCGISVPTLVRSRPLAEGDNTNYVLFNFNVLKDTKKVHDGKKINFVVLGMEKYLPSSLADSFMSGALVFMPKPQRESWLMEARLKANYHYVEINQDFSNLAKMRDYYTKNIDKAREITENARRYMSQFTDNDRELLISLLVLQKYLEVVNPTYSFFVKDETDDTFR